MGSFIFLLMSKNSWTRPKEISAGVLEYGLTTTWKKKNGFLHKKIARHPKILTIKHTDKLKQKQKYFFQSFRLLKVYSHELSLVCWFISEPIRRPIVNNNSQIILQDIYCQFISPAFHNRLGQHQSGCRDWGNSYSLNLLGQSWTTVIQPHIGILTPDNPTTQRGPYNPWHCLCSPRFLVSVRNYASHGGPHFI